MPGIQEILVLLGIAGAVLLGPRLKRMVTQGEPAPEPRRSKRKNKRKLSGLIRVAIVASVFVPVAAAVYFEPWHHNLRPFLYIGVGPVVVGWSTWWIGRGFKRS